MVRKSVEVRKMSQEEYDAVPLIQRGFYDKLIESGKMEIYIPVVPIASPGPVIEPKKGPFAALFDQEVVVYLLSQSAVKTAITGRLTHVYTYEVVLDDGDIVCFKQNILCIKKAFPDHMDDSQPKQPLMDD